MTFTSQDIFDLLELFSQSQGSDVHFRSGRPPFIRNESGQIQNLESEPARSIEEPALLEFLKTISQNTPHEAYIKKIIELASEMQRLKTGSVVYQDWTPPESFDMVLPVIQYKNQNAQTKIRQCRYRIHVTFAQSKDTAAFGVGLSLRKIPEKPKHYSELGLSGPCLAIVKQILTQRITNGLILVSGPTGSGKSTTIASILQAINETLPAHVLSLEDPIEFVYQDQQARFTQRQIGKHVLNFTKGLYDAVREDPDIIMVGEIRDESTAQMAIEAAKTGHLVLSTIHASGSTISALSKFIVLSGCSASIVTRHTKAVIGQKLLSSILSTPGSGRHLCQEIILPARNQKLRSLLNEENLIDFPDQTVLYTTIGLNELSPHEQSFEDSLTQAYREKKITAWEAVAACENELALEKHINGLNRPEIQESGPDQMVFSDDYGDDLNNDPEDIFDTEADYRYDNLESVLDTR